MLQDNIARVWKQGANGAGTQDNREDDGTVSLISEAQLHRITTIPIFV